MAHSVLVVSSSGSVKFAFLSSLAIAFPALLCLLPTPPLLFPPRPSVPSLLLSSSPLTSGPIFVLANFIVLAILISSGSLKLSDILASIAFPLQPSLLKVLIWRKESVSGVREARENGRQQQRQPATASIPVGSVVRSKSDQGRPIATLIGKSTQKSESMDSSVVLSAHCDHMSSSMIVADRLPVTSADLNDDDDFQRKCEDFIAKVRAKIKKEALE